MFRLEKLPYVRDQASPPALPSLRPRQGKSQLAVEMEPGRRAGCGDVGDVAVVDSGWRRLALAGGEKGDGIIPRAWFWLLARSVVDSQPMIATANPPSNCHQCSIGSVAVVVVDLDIVWWR